jgi:hypothetical protein
LPWFLLRAGLVVFLQLADHVRRIGAALLPLTDEAMQHRLRIW